MAHLGSVTINTSRSIIQCAPDSVRFEADVSGLGFTPPAPTGGEIHDRRYHELLYLWNFGDATGNETDDLWSYVADILPQWKRRYRAKGPKVAHMFVRAGTFTVRVVVYDPVSGDTASGSTSVEVKDPDAEYPTTQTVLVNKATDSDFSAGLALYPSATTVQTDTLSHSETWFSNFNGGPKRRILFKRGSEWTDASFNLGSSVPSHLYFGAYGDEADPLPIMNIASSGGVHFTTWTGSWGATGGPHPDLRIQSLDFRGNFDAAADDGTGSGFSQSIFAGFHDANVFVHNCKSDGLRVLTYLAAGDWISGLAKVHIDDGYFTNFGTYALYSTQAGDLASYTAYTGVALIQKAGGLTLGEDKASQALHRSTLPFVYFEGCHLVSTDSSQYVIELLKTPYDGTNAIDGYQANLSNLTLEGGNGAVNFCGNAFSVTMPNEPRLTVHNLLVDGMVQIGSWGSQTMFTAKCTGWTIRNVVTIQPNVPRSGNLFRAWFEYAELSDWDNADATIVDAAPCKGYNCTLVDEQNDTNANAAGAPVVVLNNGDRADLPNVSDENNVLHVPVLTNGSYPSTAFAPLTTNVLWTGKVTGRRTTSGGSVTSLDTTRATGDVRDFQPDTGSSALNGATSGTVAADNIQMLRRRGTPNKGAW